MTEPERVTGLRGDVRREPYATGSKSERVAVVLATARGRFVLRRKSGPAFGDAALERLVGARVECDGFVVGTTLLAERLDVVTE